MNAPFKATSRTFAAPIAGSGTVAERLVMVQASPRFQIGSGFRARLTVDPRHRGAIALHIRADDNVLSRVFAGLRAGAIAVELERGAYCRLSELSVEATVPALSELVALHAAHVCASGLTGSGVSLRADHASRIEVSGEVERWLQRGTTFDLTAGCIEIVNFSIQ